MLFRSEKQLVEDTKLPGSVSFSDITKSSSLAEGASKAYEYGKEQLGGLGGSVAVLLVAGAAATVALPEVAVAAPIAFTLGMVPGSFTGAVGTQAQVREEQRKQGAPVQDIDVSKALTATGVDTTLNAALMAMGPLRTEAKAVLKPLLGMEGKEATETAAKKIIEDANLVGEGRMKSLGAGTVQIGRAHV